MSKGYTITDKRGVEEPKEVCRCCGSTEVHTKQYNKPTMECIIYYRKQINKLEDLMRSRQ